MPSKKKPPTLPETLRKLAGEIEQHLNPPRPKTPEELTASVVADLRNTSFKARLKARRKAKARKQTDGDTGDDGAPSAPPQPPKPSKPRSRR